MPMVNVPYNELVDVLHGYGYLVFDGSKEIKEYAIENDLLTTQELLDELKCRGLDVVIKG